MEKRRFGKSGKSRSKGQGPKDVLYYEAQELLALIQKKKAYDKALDIYKKIEEERPKSYPRCRLIPYGGGPRTYRRFQGGLAVFKKTPGRIQPDLFWV